MQNRQHKLENLITGLVLIPGKGQTPVYRANTALMSVLDEINHSGKAKVFFAAKGLQQDWAIKRQLLSPAYTTNWAGIPKVS